MKIGNVHFSVSHDYSEIPNLQHKSKDTYEVIPIQENVQIRFTSTGKSGTVSEEKVFRSITFDEAKHLVIFLSENSVSRTAWIEVIDDYCRDKCSPAAGLGIV